MNKRVNELIKYTQKLKVLDDLKGFKAAKSQREKETVLNEIISQLKASDDE